MRPERGQGVLCWEQIKGRWMLKSLGKITQRVAFRLNPPAAFCFIVFNQYPTGRDMTKVGSLLTVLLPYTLLLSSQMDFLCP